MLGFRPPVVFSPLLPDAESATALEFLFDEVDGIPSRLVKNDMVRGKIKGLLFSEKLQAADDEKLLEELVQVGVLRGSSRAGGR